MADSDKIFEDLLNRGHSAAWERDWEQAKTWYRRALEKNPDHLVALSNLGLAYYELGEYDEALKIYLQHAKKAPEDPVPFEKLGQIYEKKGKSEKAVKYALYAGELYVKIREINRAIENWVRATRNDPQNLQAHSRLALVYERLGQKQQAVREYLIIASLYQHNNDQENAIRSVEHALALMPDNQKAQRASELLKTGELLPFPILSPEALSEAEREQPASIMDTGEHLVTAGADPIQETHHMALRILADTLFEESALDTQQSETASHRGIQGIMEGARNLISRPTDHGRITAHLRQALEMQTTGEEVHAAEDLEKAITAGLTNPAAFFELGYLRAQEARLESAIRALQKAAPYQEYSLAAHLLLGQLYRKMERVTEAAQEYLLALRVADMLTLTDNQWKVIDQLYEPIIETLKKQTELQVNVQICENIEGLLIRKDWRNHLVEVRERLNAGSQSGQLTPLAEMVTHTESGNLVDALNKIYQLAREGHSRSAMEEAFFVLQLTPGYLPLHTYVGDMLYKEGQVEDAVNKYIIVARTYEARNEPDRAIEVYRRIIELVPMADTPRRGLISQLLTMGKNEEAISETMNLADVYYHLADLEHARSTYLEGLNIANQSSIASTRQVQILHLIADIDIQSLNWRQALRLFEQIRSIAPSDEEARYRLIDLNMRLEQQSRATAELDNYLAYLEKNGKGKQALGFLNKLKQENAGWSEWLNPRVSQLTS